MEITKLLSNCPTYTGLAWIEYNKNTSKILFKKVLTYDETIGIYDATTTNDLYSSSLIDRKSLHYFANLEEGEVYFITEEDSMWEEYGFFAKTRAHAWKFTNQKIKEYSKADYLKKIIREHGSEGIKVLRLYNVVIKDKNRNLIYILSICNENQLVALTSFAFNVGKEAFRKSRLLTVIKKNTQDFIGIKTEFLRWVYADKKPLEGLKNRRNKEFEMYKKPCILQK